MVAVYLPKGSIMQWANNIDPLSTDTAYYSITEHNRQSLDVSVSRIENSKRMADGTLRKYVIADKRKWATSWAAIPDQASASMSVDGKWSALEIEHFYNTVRGAFTMKIMPMGSVSFTDTGDIVTTTSPHKLYPGDTIQFGTISTTTGLVANTTYYVLTVPTPTTFTISATRNGSKLLLTNNGSAQSMSQTYTVMLTDFSKTIEKRGAVNVCNVSLSLEEV